MKRWQEIWAGPPIPLIWTKCERTAIFFSWERPLWSLIDTLFDICHISWNISLIFNIFWWLHRYYAWKIGISMCRKMQLLEIRGSVSCREWGRVVAPSCLRHSSFLSGLKLAWSQLSQVFDLLPTRSKEREGAAIAIRQAAAMLPGRHCTLLLRQMIRRRRPLSWNKL